MRGVAVRWREWLAYKIAPWVYVPYREDREEAFRDLAEVAYLSRDAVWTSPSVLVKTALDVASRGPGRGKLAKMLHVIKEGAVSEPSGYIYVGDELLADYITRMLDNHVPEGR